MRWSVVKQLPQTEVVKQLPQTVVRAAVKLFGVRVVAGSSCSGGTTAVPLGILVEDGDKCIVAVHTDAAR